MNLSFFDVQVCYIGFLKYLGSVALSLTPLLSYSILNGQPKQMGLKELLQVIVFLMLHLIILRLSEFSV